jgi:hypothetical protein
MLLGKHSGPPCEARCGWRLDQILAAAGHTRHITCPPGQAPAPAPARTPSPQPEPDTGLDAKLAELDRLAAATRTARDIARDMWPGRFRDPEPEPEATL